MIWSILIGLIANLPAIIETLKKIFDLLRHLKGHDHAVAEHEFHGILLQHHGDAHGCQAKLEDFYERLKAKHGHLLAS